MSPTEVRLLEGTNIPELTLEQDAPWMGVVLPRYQQLDDELVTKLNYYANVVGGLQSARQALERDKHTGAVGTFSAFSNISSVQRHARRRFYNLLLGDTQRGRRNGLEVACTSARRPSQAIDLSRKLLAIVGEDDIEEAMTTGRHLYDVSLDDFERGVQLLADAGLDLRAVLLGSPTTFVNRATSSDERFVDLGKAAERRYRARIAKVANGATAIVVPRVDTTERLGADLQHPERYEQVAHITDIPLERLQAAYPGLDKLSPDVLANVLKDVADLADAVGMDRDLLIRDLAPLMPDKNGDYY